MRGSIVPADRRWVGPLVNVNAVPAPQQECIRHAALPLFIVIWRAAVPFRVVLPDLGVPLGRIYCGIFRILEPGLAEAAEGFRSHALQSSLPILSEVDLHSFNIGHDYSPRNGGNFGYLMTTQHPTIACLDGQDKVITVTECVRNPREKKILQDQPRATSIAVARDGTASINYWHDVHLPTNLKFACREANRAANAPLHDHLRRRAVRT